MTVDGSISTSPRGRPRRTGEVRSLVAVLVAAAFVLPPVGGRPVEAADHSAASPIEHLLVLMQENHTFDNYFGTFPGADGLPEDTCIPIDPADSTKGCVKPYHLPTLRTVDLNHGSVTHRQAYNDGKMDGFIATQNVRNLPGEVALGYYDGSDLPLYWNLAAEYVLADRFFSAVHSGSEPNHMHWVAARSARGSVPETGYLFPTIFDRLDAAGISWKFYVRNYDPSVTFRTRDPKSEIPSQLFWVPLLNFARFLDEPRLSSRIVDMSEYFKDLENGTLPAIAYLAPSGASEHPPGDVGLGQVFSTSLITALMRSTSWDSSMFLLTWDDWGGWYDHVPPPQIDADGYGFRVPGIIVSPYAERGRIDSTTYDFSSILRFIEENWNIEPLTARDATANSLGGALNFAATPREPRFPGPVYPDKPDIEARNRTALTIVYGAVGIAVVALFLLFARWRSPLRRTSPRAGTDA